MLKPYLKNLNKEKIMQIDKNNLDHAALYWLTGLKPNKEDVQLYRKCVEIKGDNATRTDGGCLLTTRISNMPDGMYEVTKRSKAKIELVLAHDVEFPNWKELFTIDMTKYTTIDIACKVEGNNFTGIANILRILPEKYAVNWNLFNIITSIDHIFSVDIPTNKAAGAIRFIGNERSALLMPMRK